MKKQKLGKGKYIVLKQNGKTHFVKKANKNMLVESPDNIEIVEKTESKLIKEEKDLIKEEKQLKSGKTK
jgi:hypothetical protein